jgi:TonB family protein
VIVGVLGISAVSAAAPPDHVVRKAYDSVTVTGRPDLATAGQRGGFVIVRVAKTREPRLRERRNHDDWRALVAPIKIRTVLPEYPDGAAEAGIRGDVYVEAVVTRTGSVVEPVLIRGLPNDELNRRALEAIRGWEFDPGRVDGEPVDVLALFTVSFRAR